MPTTDPDPGIPELVSRLTQDARRLMVDEVRLLRIETLESVHEAARGGLWLGLAFGALVIALAALTVLLATLIGRIAGGHMWIGSVAVGVVELAGGAWLVKHGLHVLAEPSWSLEESRHALADTGHWTSPP